MESVKIKSLLNELIIVIHSIIDEGRKKRILEPSYIKYKKSWATDFEYGNKGFQNFKRLSREFSKPIWDEAAQYVFKKIKKLKIYDDTFKALSEYNGLTERKTNIYLPFIIIHVAKNILEGKVKNFTDTNKYIDSFLRDINGENQEFRILLQLKALILQPKSINLGNGVKLRRPELKDFTEEIPIYSITNKTKHMDTTAILDIKIHSDSKNSRKTIINTIERIVAIFRLFRVGAIEYIGYYINSSSLLEGSGKIETTSKLWGKQKYLITREDVKLLKIFWKNVIEIELPYSVYSTSKKEPNALSISYNRYLDSLESGVAEKRISSAVMGLEALYLSPGEQQDMSYRLSMRVSKLLSLTGYDPIEVRTHIKDAYNIRSTYVHGSLVSKKSSRKYENKYSNLIDFSEIIMDYLRASIVVLLKMPNKAFITQKIDDSLLDSKKEEEVTKFLFSPYS